MVYRDIDNREIKVGDSVLISNGKCILIFCGKRLSTSIRKGHITEITDKGLKYTDLISGKNNCYIRANIKERVYVL